MLVAALLALGSVVAETSAQTTTVLRSGVIGAGGAPSAAAGYRLNGTLGQPQPIGVTQNQNHVQRGGFWVTQSYLGVTPVPEVEIPRFQLLQNHPNPFNPATTIEYSLATGSLVRLDIYNLRGRLVRELVNARQEPGRYRVLWDGRDNGGRSMASGAYVYRLEAGNFLSIKRMTLVK
jgi:hypothetical protein